MWGGVHTSKVSFASVLAQDHSVTLAVPIRNKAFDLTLRLWRTVRINPMHHRHLSSVNENIARFSPAAEEEVAAVATPCRELGAEAEAAKLCLLPAGVAELPVEQNRSIARRPRGRSCLTNSNPAQPPTGPVAITKLSAMPKGAVILELSRRREWLHSYPRAVRAEPAISDPAP